MGASGCAAAPSPPRRTPAASLETPVADSPPLTDAFHQARGGMTKERLGGPARRGGTAPALASALEGVPDLVHGLFHVALGLAGASFSRHTAVSGEAADELLGRALGRFGL